MIRCAPKKGTDQVRATFVVADEGLYGHLVAVVGDFNGWDPTTTPMRKEGNGRVATVSLQAGRRYAFRYLSDGVWFNDDTADAYEPNDLGVDNSILDLTISRAR
jgi:hypothetical protein